VVIVPVGPGNGFVLPDTHRREYVFAVDVQSADEYPGARSHVNPQSYELYEVMTVPVSAAT